MRNILLKIAYDGTDFSGWQRQPDKRTVCGTLEAALSELLGFEVKLDGTSRTDAGVHALGQCASLVIPDDGIPTERLAKAVNDRLSFGRLEGIGDVRVLSAEEMPEGFHARYSSEGKRYIYRIYVSPVKSVFRRTRFYQLQGPLDLVAMSSAARLLSGEHDFAAFMSSGSTPQESTVRKIYGIDLNIYPAEESPRDAFGGFLDRLEPGDDPQFPYELRISVSGNGFLYNMVRIIVGTLVEVGQGKRDVLSVSEALEKGDRGLAGHTAPPHGLYLDEVFFARETLKS